MKGGEFKIGIRRNVLCLKCYGFGSEFGERRICDICKGFGRERRV